MSEITLLSRLGSFLLLQKHRFKVKSSIEKSRRKRGVKSKVPADPLPRKDDVKKLGKLIVDGLFVFGGYSPREILKNKDAPEDEPERKYRGLSIPSPRDRVVHKAMVELLVPKFLPYLLEAPSYGVLKERGIKSAVKDLQKHIANGYEYLLVADIQKFFNRINKDLLIREILNHLDDHSVGYLITQIVNAKYKTVPKHKILFPTDEMGIPQGCALSPIFSDIYLKKFDTEMEKSGYTVIRYIDDFAVPCKTKRERYNCYRRARKILKSIRLDLDPYRMGKCKATHITERPTLLGFELGLGSSILPNHEKYSCYKQHIGNLISSLPDKKRAVWPALSNELNAMIQGWCGAYDICDKDIMAERFKELNSMVSRIIDDLLKAKKISEAEREFLLRKIQKFKFPRSNKRIGRVTFKQKKHSLPIEGSPTLLL